MNSLRAILCPESGQASRSKRRRRAELMRMAMADQCARIRCAIVRNRFCSIGSDCARIEVDKSLAGDRSRLHSHSVSAMAYRAREAVVDMVSVLAETCITHYLVKVVALAAHRVWPGHAQVRVGK